MSTWARKTAILGALRSVVVVLFQLAATATYLVGLAAPLTPSAGAPAVRSVFIYAAAPAAAMALSLVLARHPFVRFIILCETLIAIGFSTLLLMWSLS